MSTVSAVSETGDRELQDRIIRYLTDGNHSVEVQDVPLSAEEAEKALRFSKFLARRYYRDRLTRGFRYSKHVVELSRETKADNSGLYAEDIVDSPRFDEILFECVLGSLDTARRVAELAVAQLRPLALAPWWDDLLQYELAFFIQLATSELSDPTTHPKLSANTITQTFRWKMPELLSRLKSEAPITDALGGEVTLLFSRTHRGRIYVVELDQEAHAVIDAMNGNRTADEIAATAGLGVEETNNLLSTLREIGA
jgi:hypothetical protein